MQKIAQALGVSQATISRDLAVTSCYDQEPSDRRDVLFGSRMLAQIAHRPDNG